MGRAASAGLLFIGDAPGEGDYSGLIREAGGGWFNLSEAKAERVGAASALVVDVSLSNVGHVRVLQKLLSALPDNVPRLFVVDKGLRVEVVYASVIGATAIANRPLGKSELQDFLGRHHQPRQDVPDADTRRSIESAAGSLEDLFLAASSGGAPDQVKLYAACDEVATAISQDGLGRWLDAVRSHHHGTLQHCLIVSGVLTRFGQSTGMSERDVRLLTEVGLLHDVGKAAIPASILDSPNKLSDAEFALVKKHPYKGFEFLCRHGDIDEDVLAAVVGHHEYLDGSGYPYGISGKAIGDLVRIATICDIYGALVERRAYKPEMQPEAAMAAVEQMAETGKVENALVRALARAVL